MEQIDAMDRFKILTTSSVGKEVARIKEAFQKKHELEKQIASLIKDYEDQTGLAIDMIKYQRDITIPIRSAKYTALSIVITAEE